MSIQTPLGVGHVETGAIYLLRDEFRTDDALPITSPRTCEPGPGTLEAVTPAAWGIVNQIAQTTQGTGFTQTLFSSTTFPREAGLALVAKGVTGKPGESGSGVIAGAGFGTTNTVIPTTHSSYTTIGYHVGSILGNAITGMQALVNGGRRDYMTILRASGSFHLVRGDKFSNWTLYYVSPLGTNTPLYAGLFGYNLAGYSGQFSGVDIFQLAAPWITDYGVATAVTASPGADAVQSHSIRHALVEFTWTPNASEVLNLYVRRTDDSNSIIVRCDEAANTIRVWKIEAGVETAVSSAAAQTFDAGTSYRIFVMMNYLEIITHVNDVGKNFVTNSPYNVDAAGAKVNLAGTNFISWPFLLTGDALRELNIYEP